MTYTKHEQAIFNAGARYARDLVKKRVKRTAKEVLSLQQYLATMPERYRAKAGGIGRAK